MCRKFAPDELNTMEHDFFNEAEAGCAENLSEPTIEETVTSAMKSLQKPKKKGQSEEDHKDFPQEEIFHDVPEEELNDAFGKGKQKRLKEQQASIKPLVEEFFAWIREILADQKVLPKGETAKGLNYCLNQKKYLKVFLTDGEVPYYVRYLLTELPQFICANGNIGVSKLEPLMPWLRILPADCYSKCCK